MAEWYCIVWIYQSIYTFLAIMKNTAMNNWSTNFCVNRCFHFTWVSNFVSLFGKPPNCFSQQMSHFIFPSSIHFQHILNFTRVRTILCTTIYLVPRVKSLIHRIFFELDMWLNKGINKWNGLDAFQSYIPISIQKYDKCLKTVLLLLNLH